MPNVRAVSAATSDSADRTARSTSQSPSAGRGLSRLASSRANRVLPTPPDPASVSSRVRRNVSLRFGSHTPVRPAECVTPVDHASSVRSLARAGSHTEGRRSRAGEVAPHARCPSPDGCRGRGVPSPREARSRRVLASPPTAEPGRRGRRRQSAPPDERRGRHTRRRPERRARCECPCARGRLRFSTSPPTKSRVGLRQRRGRRSEGVTKTAKNESPSVESASPPAWRIAWRGISWWRSTSGCHLLPGFGRASWSPRCR